MTKLLGQRIGHFRVVDFLAKGGMGEVYVGYDETLERKVALKTIKAERRLDANARARFLREARVLSQLHHPNICQIFDYIRGEDVDVLVLEFVNGRNLSHVAESLSFREKLRIGEQIARVLQAAHEKGIVHRDLKPDNVMLDEKRQVKVLDFGLSRSPVGAGGAGSRDGNWELGTPTNPTPDTAGAESTIIPTDPNADTRPEPDGRDSEHANFGSALPLTQAGAVMGTLAYMSPEQARGEAATPASDVYSLGLLLQQLFTGRKAYDPVASAHAFVQKIASGDTIPVTGLDSDVTALINRMKSLAPAARPSAIDVVERLRRVADRPARRIKQTIGAAAVVILVLFGVVMTIQTLRATKAERRAAQEAESAIRQAQRATQAEGRAEKEAEGAFRERSRAVDAEKAAKAEAARAIKAEASALKETAAAKRAEAEAARREQTTQKVTLFLRSMFQLADPRISKGRELTARQLLDAARARVEDLNDEPQTQAAVLNALGLIYANLGDATTATALLERSIAIPTAASDTGELNQFEASLSLARHYTEIGDYDKAGKLWPEALQWAETNLGPNHLLTALAAAGFANFYVSTGRFDDASRMIAKALTALGEPTTLEQAQLAASILQDAALAAYKQGNYQEAEKVYLMAIDFYSWMGETDELKVAACRNALAWTYIAQGKYTSAEDQIGQALAVQEKVLGDRHPAVADLLKARAAILFSQGGGDGLEPLLRRIVDIHRDAFSPGNSYRLDSAYTLGVFLLFGRKEPLPSEAEDLFIECVPYFESQSNPYLFNVYYSLACCAALQARQPEAISYLKQALPGSGTWVRNIATDPLLDSLRGATEFEEIVVAVELKRRALE